MSKSARYCVYLLLLGILLTACNGSPAATPTSTPTPDAKKLLNTAAGQVQNSKSLRFKLQRTGAPAYVDNSNLIEFVTTNGNYLEPSSVSGTVVARIGGIAGEVEIVAIGDDQWYKNAILTANHWVKALFAPGFNAAKLIKSDEGIQSALNAIKNLKYIGQEDVFGTPMYHLTGDAAAADVSALTVGLIKGADTVIDIYIVVETGRVDHVVIVQPLTVTDQYPDPTKWTLEIYDYDATDIKIVPPENADVPVAATPVMAGSPTPIPTVGSLNPS